MNSTCKLGDWSPKAVPHPLQEEISNVGVGRTNHSKTCGARMIKRVRVVAASRSGVIREPRGDLKNATSTQPSRSELRLADLKARGPVSSKLMNVKIPSHLADAIAKLGRMLNASKAAVVVALLNEGLSAAARVNAKR